MDRSLEIESVILDEIHRMEEARRSLIKFTTFTKPDYIVGWHHEAIAGALDDWAFGPVDKLMIFAPPRHGKSELTSRRLPAYIFGRNPDAKIISTSYGAELASLNNRDVQRIIDSEEYAALFPHSRLFGENIRSTAKGSWLRNSDIFEIVNRRGVYRSAGVGGALTGTGGDYIIIDDPIKNAEDAESPGKREKLKSWYDSVLVTRLERNGKLLIILTRWHEDDLAGKILAMEGGWKVVCLPAINEEGPTEIDPRPVGEALWPWKYNAEKLEKRKANMALKYWNALYQQRPSAKEGDIFKRDNWLFWSELPKRFDKTIIVWDMTFKKTETGSFVVGQVWGRLGENVYLIDQYRQRVGFVKALEAVQMLSKKHPSAMKKYVENKANGDAIMDALRGHQYGVEGYNPQGSKEARAHAVSYVQEYKRAYLPPRATHPWIDAYIEELATFPNGTHDDQVDATSMAWEILFGSYGISRLEELLTGL